MGHEISLYMFFIKEIFKKDTLYNSNGNIFFTFEHNYLNMLLSSLFAAYFQVYIETYRIRFLKAEKSPQKDMDGFVNRVGKITLVQ